MKKNTLTLLTIACAVLHQNQVCAQAVDFTLSLDTASNPGATYEDLNAAGAGLEDAYVIGFQIDITAINGSATSFASPFASFCTELEEPVGLSSYSYDFDDLSGVSSGRAGELTSASSAIPLGGIGDLAAARVRALFDNHYSSSTLSDWSFSTVAPLSQAFQLALWEITHDSDLSLSSTAGSIYIGAQSTSDLTTGVTLAQSWVDELTAVSTSYTSTTWDVWAIENVGAPGNQDILFATSIGDYEFRTVPEPSSALLLALGGMAAIRRRRR